MVVGLSRTGRRGVGSDLGLDGINEAGAIVLGLINGLVRVCSVSYDGKDKQ